MDTDDLASAATDLDSVDFGDAAWNQAVRGPTMLDTGTARCAHFASISVQVTGPRQGILHSTLILRGQAVPANVAFTLNRHGITIFNLHNTIGFSGRAILDRHAFGMLANPGSIGQMVSVRQECLARFFHWTIAVLILVQSTISLVMVNLPRRPDIIPVCSLHKSISLTILTLAILRLAWRVFDTRPPRAPMPGWQDALSRITHVALYILIFAVPLPGWLFDSASSLRPLCDQDAQPHRRPRPAA